MTLMHVLGGLSLLILVAVSTMIRAGIGFEHGDGTAEERETAVDAAETGATEVVADPTLDPVAVLGPIHFGPLLDRMRR